MSVASVIGAVRSLGSTALDVPLSDVCVRLDGVDPVTVSATLIGVSRASYYRRTRYDSAQYNNKLALESSRIRLRRVDADDAPAPSPPPSVRLVSYRVSVGGGESAVDVLLHSQWRDDGDSVVSVNGVSAALSDMDTAELFDMTAATATAMTATDPHSTAHSQSAVSVTDPSVTSAPLVPVYRSPVKRKRSLKAAAAPSADSSGGTGAAAPVSRRGFMAVVRLSDGLSQLLGYTYLPRPLVVSQLWAYIKREGLQLPTDRRVILLNAELKRLMPNTDRLKMTDISQYLRSHLFKVPSNTAEHAEAERIAKEAEAALALSKEPKPKYQRRKKVKLTPPSPPPISAPIDTVVVPVSDDNGDETDASDNTDASEDDDDDNDGADDDDDDHDADDDDGDDDTASINGSDDDDAADVSDADSTVIKERT